MIKFSINLPLMGFEPMASPLPRECATPAPQRLISFFGVLAKSAQTFQALYSVVIPPAKQTSQQFRGINQPAIGIEPTTYGLQNRCSTVELCRHNSIVFIKLFYVKQYFLTFYKNSLLTCQRQYKQRIFTLHLLSFFKYCRN